MQIDNWFDFIIFSAFTIAVLFVGLPGSIYLLKKGAEGFVKYKFSKLPKGFLISPGFGTYAIEITFYGLFMFAGSVYCLFIDRGGLLSNLITHGRSLLAS